MWLPLDSLTFRLVDLSEHQFITGSIKCRPKNQPTEKLISGIHNDTNLRQRELALNLILYSPEHGKFKQGRAVC